MPKSVLYADDDPGIRRLVERGLGAQGIRIVTVEDGLAAVERLQQEEFDVVALDHHMPRLDGLGALERIHKVAEPSTGDHRHRRTGFDNRGRRTQGRRLRLRPQGRVGPVRPAAACRADRRRRSDAAAARPGGGGSGIARATRPLRAAGGRTRHAAARGQSSCRQFVAADRGVPAIAGRRRPRTRRSRSPSPMRPAA